MTHTLRNLILAFAICTELFIIAEAGGGHGHGHRHHRGHRHRHNRYRRDLSGHYHPELHGDQAHLHVHSHETNDLGGHGEVHSIISTNGNEHSHASTAVFTSGGDSSGAKGGYSYPPVPSVDPPPNLPPNCACFLQDKCDETARSFTELVVRTQATDRVCGTAYKMCCFKDWPGFTDAFAHLAPCVPNEFCQRHYGTSPTDVAEYGSIGPCPGHDTVRCLDNKVPINQVPIGLAPIPVQINHEGPTHFVVPILDTPIIPGVPFAPSYGPSSGYEPPALQQPAPGYAPPAPAPAYAPPAPSYAAPAPAPEPPLPPSGGYAAPAPAPEPPLPPSGGYAAPAPAPEPPSGGYAAPSPVQPPSVSYGVPGVPYGRPLGYYSGGYGGYPYSRFAGGLYPGFGFRKHFHFSKGFGFF